MRAAEAETDAAPAMRPITQRLIWNIPIARAVLRGTLDPASTLSRLELDTVRMVLVDFVIPEWRAMTATTSLRQAADSGQMHQLQLALNLTQVHVDRQDKCGVTSLMEAAGSGHCTIVEALLQGGANINMQANAGGSTALMWAASKGHAATVRLLISAAAEVNLKDRFNGTTALMKAAGNLTRRASKRETQGTTACASALVRAKALLDDVDNLGNTALMLASSNGHVGTVGALLQAGANLQLQNLYGRTACTWASTNGHKAVGKAWTEPWVCQLEERRDVHHFCIKRWLFPWGPNTHSALAFEYVCVSLIIRHDTTFRQQRWCQGQTVVTETP